MQFVILITQHWEFWLGGWKKWGMNEPSKGCKFGYSEEPYTITRFLRKPQKGRRQFLLRKIVKGQR